MTHTRWLLPGGVLLTLCGYFGPWVPHPVAGLVIPGLDLGEYVKFLAPVQRGEISVWREGFYLPLLAVSLIASLYAFDRGFRYGWPVRMLLVSVAIVAALNMLPPAWTPALLRTAEFRLQTYALTLCLAAMAGSPLLALIPRTVRSGVALFLIGAAIWWPLRDFWRVLPHIRSLYSQPLAPGWGLYTMCVGLAVVAITIIGVAAKSEEIREGSSIRT